MPRKPVTKPSLSSEPSASLRVNAEAAAKVTYERQHIKRVTVNIPEDVTRERNSAFMDMISPVRHWLGIRGDVQEHRRKLQQIRHDHERATLEIVGQQFAKALSPGFTPIPPPLKFLSHFVEKAGLEEPDSPLVALWGNLLASASETYDARFIHLVNVVSSMSAKQAVLFKTMFRATTIFDLQREIDNVDTGFAMNHAIQVMKDNIGKCEPKTDDDFVEAVAEYFNIAVVQVERASACRIIGNPQPRTGFEIKFPYPTAARDDYADKIILEALGLIRHVDLPQDEYAGWSMSVSYHYLTRLGLLFAEACKI